MSQWDQDIDDFLIGERLAEEGEWDYDQDEQDKTMSEGFDCQESSNLKWARYDRAAQVLEIDFKNKAGVKVSTYAYDNFPPEAWDSFQKATSRGRHFAYAIRPKYKGRKVATLPPDWGKL